MIEAYNFLRFGIAFEKFKREQEDNINNNFFLRRIDELMNDFKHNSHHAKIIEISDKQKDFFLKGKVSMKGQEIKLPFPEMFFDVNFTKEELAEYGINIEAKELIGLIVHKGYVYPESSKDELLKIQNDIPELAVGECIRYTVCFRYDDIEGESIQFETFIKDRTITDFNYKDASVVDTHEFVEIQVHEFWYRFFYNFIRFVNHPEIRLKSHIKSEKNIERRRKQGRPEIPEIITVELSGVLEKYIDEVYMRPKTHWHYNYSFDVKGHYRNLTSPRYKEPKTIWVENFTKGEGTHIPSVYKVKKKRSKHGN